MEEELLRLIKRIVDERVDDHGVILFDLDRVRSLAVEMGLDVSFVRTIFENLNKMLEEKFKERKSGNIP